MHKPLVPLTAKKAAEQARAQIIQERSGEQLGVKTRYSRLNIAMRKYFRFNNVNVLAGLSGSGKSYMLNNLMDSFLDYETPDSINYGISFIPIVAHFCFEMSAANEVLRMCASDLGMNYNYLLSSEYDKDNKTYNRLTDEELARVDAYLNYFSKRAILFYETSSNLEVIKATVNQLFKRYPLQKKNEKGKILNYRLIVNIDHTLLIEKLDEKSTLDLMENTGKAAIYIRKSTGAMVNLIGQLNNKIEDTQRILTPALHYPKKSDIYAQGQLFNACDTVFVWHRPDLLKIPLYGLQNLPTKGLFHLLVLKARHGNVGSLWFKDDLGNGRIKQIEKDEDSEEPIEEKPTFEDDEDFMRYQEL